MAKFYSSTFGAISGKHGSAVAVTRKDGVSYIRMHVIPHNPRTDKQQAHRSKIGLVSKSLAPFNSVFKHTMGVTNGISIARSHAFKNAIVDEYPNFAIDYKKLMFSFGTLHKLQNARTSFHNSVVSINWDFKKMYNCHNNDRVSLIVFNKDNSQVLHLDDVAMRSDKEAQIKIHDSWAGSQLYIWAYVSNGDGISDSVYVGEDTLVYDKVIDSVCTEDESISASEVQVSDKVSTNASYGVELESDNEEGEHIDPFVDAGINTSLRKYLRVYYDNMCPSDKMPTSASSDGNSYNYREYKYGGSCVLGEYGLYIKSVHGVPNLLRTKS